MVLVAVVCSVVGTPACLYLVVHAAAPTACACMDIPHGLASAGTFACVSWCGVPFFFSPCGALRLGGLFPLSISHTLLVPWLPCPMRAGDSSGRALLLVVHGVAVVPFPSCVDLGSLRSCGCVAYRVTYLVRRPACSRGVYPMLSCCFALLVGVWGAHKSPTPIACTLLSDLGHATFSFPVLAALLSYNKKGG